MNAVSCGALILLVIVSRASGPSRMVPSWTAESDQLFANFGWSVAGAGDVNGDGYDDVVVGAVFFDNGQQDEGRAFVYLGSDSGLSAAPVWGPEGNQFFANERSERVLTWSMP